MRPPACRTSIGPAALGKTLLAWALVVTAGCASARNYEQPDGPILVGPAVSHPTSLRRSSEIRLVTFNIEFGQHVDKAAILLSRYGPLHGADVICLQEMDEPGTATLARVLEMNYVYIPSAIHPSPDRDFGVAILSRWPIEDARKVPLPHEHRFRKLRRAAAAATVLAPIGPLRVYSVHLETAFGLWRGKHRREQARAILHDAMDWPGPIVIAGDFNGRAGADEIAKAGYVWLTERLHKDAFLFDFDHMLVRGLCTVGDRPAGKARDEIGASDHRPVWAVARPCSVTYRNQAGVESWTTRLT
jgi:endonuclease/exonuclease/phosphatase family metal-dependent hydrolase